MLVFCEGQLKSGGQREESGRQKKRPHRALLFPDNHYLPGTFVEAAPIDEEDGELTSSEVPDDVASVLVAFPVMHVAVMMKAASFVVMR